MKVILDLPTEADSAIALAIGKFDGVHLGHRAVIKRLKQNASARRLPACVLTFDPHPVEYFMGARAPARLTALPDKIRLLESLGVDRLYVCPFTEGIAGMSPEAFVFDVLVERLGVRALLLGEDFHFGAGRCGDVGTLRTLGGPVGLEVNTLEGLAVDGIRVSSTAIRAAIAKGDDSFARRFLGWSSCSPAYPGYVGEPRNSR
ncbi:Riboflavin biosynthesis protein RibF (plasmid) [Variovorax sp. SRS16]|uniref:hypothetical protein n=1 Tax=Variovorax sp. SRS16 TaxID=282217 RepID=UPI001318D38B|nr:hypothetical protein [Variovorax sp. SRS16]VTU45269.1 Riboflavin biosynthesis protein RibF [Variovorax sp. SRS16]